MATFDEGAEDSGVDAGDLAYEAKLGGVRVGAGGEEAAVHAGKADGGGAGLVDEGDEGLVDAADEDHGDDLHGGGVSHAEAVEEVGLQAEAAEPEVDFGTAAVDEDGTEADAGEEDEVVDDGGLEGLRLHGGAAVLDYDGLAAELLDEGEGLGEDVHPGLPGGGPQGGGGGGGGGIHRGRR